MRICHGRLNCIFFCVITRLVLRIQIRLHLDFWDPVILKLPSILRVSKLNYNYD